MCVGVVDVGVVGGCVAVFVDCGVVVWLWLVC